MEQKVWREVNWAYLFALSQFFMAWGAGRALRRDGGGLGSEGEGVLTSFNH